MEEHLRILLVDDRDEFRKELSLWLKDSLEHEVEEAGDLDSALKLFKRDPERFDAALVDYGLAGNGRVGNGIELMQALHRIKDQLPVIVITGAGDRDISQQALSEKAFWYLREAARPGGDREAPGLGQPLPEDGGTDRTVHGRTVRRIPRGHGGFPCNRFGDRH